jgi:hypothetical protein
MARRRTVKMQKQTHRVAKSGASNVQEQTHFWLRLGKKEIDAAMHLNGALKRNAKTNPPDDSLMISMG